MVSPVPPVTARAEARATSDIGDPVPGSNQQSEHSATAKTVGVQRIQDQEHEDDQREALKGELEPDRQEHDHGAPTHG